MPPSPASDPRPLIDVFCCVHSQTPILDPQRLIHADGKHEMSLNPGANELRFQASPVKAGLYATRGIAAQLGSLRIALPLLPPATLRSTPGSWTRPSGEAAWPV
jgi:hypothetical protein